MAEKQYSSVMYDEDRRLSHMWPLPAHQHHVQYPPASAAAASCHHHQRHRPHHKQTTSPAAAGYDMLSAPISYFAHPQPMGVVGLHHAHMAVAAAANFAQPMQAAGQAAYSAAAAAAYSYLNGPPFNVMRR